MLSKTYPSRVFISSYKKAHNGASVYAPTFIEDCEPEVKKLQEEYGFEYTVEFVQ